MIGEAVLLELLHDAVAAAKAAGATDAEASFEGGTLGVTRFANSYFTQAGVIQEGRIRVRAALGDRVGAATTSTPTTEGVAGAARLAVEIARHQRPSDFPGFATPDPTRQLVASAVFDEATAAYGPAERADVLARLFNRAAADRLTCAGSFTTGPAELAVATAGGVARYQRYTEAGLELIALDGDASGFASTYGGTLGATDLDALAEEAVGKAVRARDAIDVEPGPLDVILAPPAVAEVLEWMAMTGFSARSLLDGGSLLTGKQGQPLCDPRITIVDDPGFAHPSAVPIPFDAEGTTKIPVTFLDHGVGGRVCTDRATARKLADERGSTGHATPIGEDLADGQAPANLVFHPGDASVDDLMARVERGLYVTRFHYVNGLLDTRRATMTGMTRDGTFLIEHGKLGRAVRNLRWTESFLDALSPARLGGIGRELRATPTTWTSVGAILCPALLLRGFHFTGRSR